MSGLSDMPGPFRLGAVAGFFALWFAVAFTPRLWGEDFFYEQFYPVGIALALLWWPVASHLGSRHAHRWREQATAHAPTSTSLLRRVRRVAWVYTLRHASVWLIVPLLAGIYVGGQDAMKHNQELIDNRPHQTATIVKTYRSPLSRPHESPEITVELLGRTEVLDLSFPGENDVSAGDTIAVVVDPDDPSYVIAVNSHDDWAYTNWGNLIILAGIGVLGGGLWLGWALAVPRRAARKAGRRARAVHLVECVDVDGVQLTLRDGNGRLWTWTADETEWSGGRPAKVHVVGDLEPASRPVVAAGRSLHWPDAPVRPAGND